MPPGLVGSELLATRPQYLKTSMDEASLFPPISRKSAISIGSDTDPNDFCNPIDRKNPTRGSVPPSLASTPLKFPTIDRANSTSIASLPGSRSTRNRSITRDLRSSYCRSPSCPSNLNMRRDFNQMDVNIFSRKESFENLHDSSANDLSVREEKGNVLPNIFSKDFNNVRGKGKENARRDKSKDTTNALSLRRSESLTQSVNQLEEHSAPVSSRDTGQNTQRQGQAAALLLPIRNTSQTNNNNKKKKKRKNRISSDADGELSENTPRNVETDCVKPVVRYNRKSDDALDVIARENEMFDENDIETPRAIEINSSRKVKQWIKSNQHSHSDNEIKV